MAALFGALAFWPNAAHGLGVGIPNQDSEAIARGNAFAATADNPSAIFYNPAGITQLPGQDIQIGMLDYLGINAHYISPTGTTANSKFHILPIPEIYYTISPQDFPLSFGLGVYAPFGLATEWPDNSAFRSLAITAKLQYITLNPVVAWKITPTLSLAAGPTFNYSTIEDARGLGIGPADFFEFKGSGISYGATAGLLWQPRTQWSIGANYRSPSTMSYSGHSSYNPEPGVTPTKSSHTTADFNFPQVISGGVSFRPTPKWNIEADVNWTDWQTLKTVTLNGTKNNPYFASIGNLALAFDWHGSWFYELGATRYFDNGWFASAGFFFSSETTSSQDFSPAVPDTDLYIGSVGFGHKGEHWHWALATQIIAGPARILDNSQPSQVPANGSYQLFVPTVSVSAGYHF